MAGHRPAVPAATPIRAGAIALLVLSCACACAFACARPPPAIDTATATATATAAIVRQMHAAWDRPGAPVDAGPVVVEADHAVADWTQGRSGGRALLRRERGAWITVLCAGDALRTSAGLHAAGVPIAQAGAMADALTDAEARVPAVRLARMAAFAGEVRMRSQESSHDPRR